MNDIGRLYRREDNEKLVLPLVLQTPERKEPYLIAFIFPQMLNTNARCRIDS